MPETIQGAHASTTRSVSQWERALLAQWLSAIERSGTDGVAAAYVSDRSRDDPRLRNMIVIAVSKKTDVTYLVHRPAGENAWILTCGQSSTELGRFRTLPEVLHTIRAPRGSTEAAANSDWVGSEEHSAAAGNER